MKIFDKQGFMIIPTPEKPSIPVGRPLVVVSECWCAAGHSLISSRALFGRFPGIMLAVGSEQGKSGFVA